MYEKVLPTYESVLTNWRQEVNAFAERTDGRRLQSLPNLNTLHTLHTLLCNSVIFVSYHGVAAAITLIEKKKSQASSPPPPKKKQLQCTKQKKN
jgi:hypothetical protein